MQPVSAAPLGRFTAGLALILALVANSLGAQTHGCPEAPEASAGGAVYWACQLDALPTPDLDPQRVGSTDYRACGEVPLSLVIDARGAVSSVDGRAPADNGTSVCEDLAKTWRFWAGRVDNVPVAARIELRLRYGERRRRDALWDPIVQLAPAGDGLHDLSVEWRAPAPGSVVPLGAAAEDSALAAAMSEVASRGTVDNLDHVCFDMSAPNERVRRVAALVRGVDQPRYTRTACPSIRQVTPGVLGYTTERPYLHVGARSVMPAAPDAVVIDAWYARGMRGAGYWCRASRTRRGWRASCIELWSA